MTANPGAGTADHLIVGAGLSGLRVALGARRDGAVLTLDAANRPGGSVCTERVGGFVRELGPFAFAMEEVTPLLQELDVAPPLLLAACESGLLFDGSTTTECAVAPPPVAFADGCDAVVRAAQHTLGDQLRLECTAHAIEPTDSGFRVELADAEASPLASQRITLATPLDQTARLLAGFDPALPDLTERLERTPRALVFLGAAARDCEQLHGYGILPTDEVEDPLVEVIHCSRVFPNRSPAESFLMRCELADVPNDTDDDALVDATRTTLASWAGWQAEPTFTHVHRFDTIDQDAVWVECLTRIQALATRLDGLSIA